MDGYTIKEMVSEIRKHNQQMESRQIRMESNLEKILDQAVLTNGKVANNYKKITKLESEHGKIRTIFTTLSILLTLIWAGVTFIFK